MGIRVPRWLVYSLLTVVAWGAWGVLSKALGNMSAGQSQAFSTLGILPIMLAVALSRRFGEGRRRFRGALLAFAAGVLVGLGNAAYYQAVALDKAATIASFSAVYPVVTVVLALLVLRENPNAWQFAGIAGSLVAMYLLAGGRATAEESREWLFYALSCVGLYGGAALVMKIAADDVSAEQSTFWFLGAFIPLSAWILIARPRMLVPEATGIEWSLSGRDWLFVTLLGATYGIGNLMVLAAYRNGGKASVVTPLTGLYPVVTIPLAMVFFGERIGWREAAGIGLALASAVAISIERNHAPETAAGLAANAPP